MKALGSLIFRAALWCALNVSATTYYLATNGLDTNPGTSTNAPWRTIQHAANVLAPGDTVLVRGGVYNETVTFQVSGKATNNVITFENFPGEAPVVDGTGLPMAAPVYYATGLLEFTNASYVIVQGFEIRNYQASNTSYVPAGVDIVGAPHDLTFVSNRIHNIANLSGSSSANAYGIAIHGTLPQAISNLLFRGNEIYSNTLGQSEAFSFDGNVSGFEVSGNFVHDNNNIGIGFIGYEGVCSVSGLDYARNGICRSNTVWDISDAANPAYPANDYSADGIYSDGGSNVLIELNSVHNCDLGVEMASEHAGHAANACVCRDNLVWSNNTTGISIGGYSASVGQTINCVVSHNTLYHNDTRQSGTGEMEFQYAPVGNTVSHNIFAANSQDLLISDYFTQNTNNLVDWNLYFAPGGSNNSTWMWKNQSYGGFASWRSGTTNDAHSLFADPLFINATNGNFHIATNSPAFNAGDPNFQSLTNQPAETDIDIQSRIAFGRTDIGADELNILFATLGIVTSSNGQVRAELTGEPGHPFVWQQSATLSNWQPLLTNYSNAAGLLQATVTVSGQQEFLRAAMTQ